MEWTKKAKGRQTVWSASLGDSPLDEKTIRAPFVEAWQHFCENTALLYRSSDWKVCRIEFWSDNGKIVIYPATWESENDIAVGVTEVISDWFRGFVRDRMFSEEEYENPESEIEDLERRLALGIGEAAEQFGVAKALDSSEIHLAFCMPGSDEPFEQKSLHS